MGIDLCGARLNYIRGNDDILNALTKKGGEGVRIRVVLPASDSPFLDAVFQDGFVDEIKQSATALAKELKTRCDKIEVKFLKKKALTMALLRVDDIMLVTPYIYSSRTFNSPRLLVRGSGTSLFQQYAKEFQSLFSISDPAP